MILIKKRPVYSSMGPEVLWKKFVGLLEPWPLKGCLQYPHSDAINGSFCCWLFVSLTRATLVRRMQIKYIDVLRRCCGWYRGQSLHLCCLVKLCKSLPGRLVQSIFSQHPKPKVTLYVAPPALVCCKTRQGRASPLQSVWDLPRD